MKADLESVIPWPTLPKVNEKLQIALLKHVFESRIALRRIFQEMIVLRRIFNYSEEDISGNDSSEDDKSEEVIKLF